MASSSSAARIPAAVYWLAFGAFAIGTESFMISPLLPGLVADLHVSIAAAGQLVTVFALAYGLSSPVLTTLTGSANRRSLLIWSMLAFALANLLAWHARSYEALMTARVLLAFSAGLYMPGANALASVIAPLERRGRALAVVNGGITMAIALGVPLGALVGHQLGWRMTFLGVAGLAALATVALTLGMAQGTGDGTPTASLRERIAVGRQPIVLMTLLSTTLWATGAYTVYTYLALYLSAATGFEGAQISPILFMWGVAAGIGLFIGGSLNDKRGPNAVIAPAILLAALAFYTLSASAQFLSPMAARVPVIIAIIVWGSAHWGFFPAQQTRLIQTAGVKVASIVLSLNASFMYIGFSMGAALGALTISRGSVTQLGWVGGSCELAAAWLAWGIQRHLATRQTSVGMAAA